jgi:hypothetical protein
MESIYLTIRRCWHTEEYIQGCGEIEMKTCILYVRSRADGAHKTLFPS